MKCLTKNCHIVIFIKQHKENKMDAILIDIVPPNILFVNAQTDGTNCLKKWNVVVQTNLLPNT